VGFVRYLTAAFKNRWNLLALFGSLGFAALSGATDVFVPLILAAELTYVGLLGANSKFQRYVDAQAAKVTREQGTATADQTLQRLMNSLPDSMRQRFETLRRRCMELRQIAMELKDPTLAKSPGTTPTLQTDNPLEEMQFAGLDRLLWIYLRLLFSQYALDRFLMRTSDDQIQKDIFRLEAQLNNVPANSEDLQQQKIRKTLEDNLATSKARLANLQKARDNREIVRLEIDRLENKIQSLSELAINRQEPDFISGQVDQVVTSMVQTEKTMNDLQFATGLEVNDDTVPELLRRETVLVKQ
jgi:chemotaxis protein histidine kinase CheA